MPDLPETANFYISLQARVSKERIAKLYLALAMEVRKCGWNGFEMCCDWAELILEADSHILMHGAVADVLENSERVLAPLREARIGYRAECYDESGELIREFSWRADEASSDDERLTH